MRRTCTAEWVSETKKNIIHHLPTDRQFNRFIEIQKFYLSNQPTIPNTALILFADMDMTMIVNAITKVKFPTIPYGRYHAFKVAGGKGECLCC